MADRAYTQQLIARVDQLLGHGYLDRSGAEDVAAKVPGLAPAILDCVEAVRAEGDWRRFERLVEIAVYVHPEGLGKILCEVLDAPSPGVNAEDLVDILGQLSYEPCVPAIVRFMSRALPGDSPYFPLAKKCIFSLGEIGSTEACDALRLLTSSSFPDAIRWWAAVELGIEDELGFDEDEMLRFP